MTRVIAAAAVLAALLFTAPASAGTYCIPDLAFCQPVPFIHGTAGLFWVSFDDDAPGGLALQRTGLDMIKLSPNDTRGQLCVNGACSGQTGYTFFTDPGFGTYIRIYTNGTCRQFAENANWFPEDCIFP